MAIVNAAPFPMTDPIAEPLSPEQLSPELLDALSNLRITKVWVDWLTSIDTRINSAPSSAGQPVVLSNQTGAIGTTTIPIQSINAGLYRVTYYMRVLIPATVSSSVAITLRTTDGGVVCVFPSAAMTSNDPSLPQTGTAMVRCDAGSVITYSTAYSSVGATSMTYRLDIVVEQLGV